MTLNVREVLCVCSCKCRVTWPRFQTCFPQLYLFVPSHHTLQRTLMCIYSEQMGMHPRYICSQLQCIKHTNARIKYSVSVNTPQFCIVSPEFESNFTEPIICPQFLLLPPSPQRQTNRLRKLRSTSFQFQLHNNPSLKRYAELYVSVRHFTNKEFQLKYVTKTRYLDLRFICFIRWPSSHDYVPHKTPFFY